MINIQNISVSFGKKDVLKDINIQEGQKIAIVGDSGCGKSTLARLIINLISPKTGNIVVGGMPIKKMNKKQKSKTVQMVFQHPKSSFNNKIKIRFQLDEVCKINNLNVDIDEYLKKFGLDTKLLDRYPFQVSGGEAQRLSIIRSMILNPKILLLDEPTSVLDVSTQAEIMNTILKLHKENNMTLVLISHDLELVSKVCDYVVIINDSKIIEQGRTKDILTNPHNDYTKVLVDNFKFFND